LIRFRDESYNASYEKHEAKCTKKEAFLKEAGNLDYNEFLKGEEMKDLYSFVKQSFNWKSGKYEMLIDVESPESFILKDNKYKFELNSLDIEYIEKNKDLIERYYEEIMIPMNQEEEHAQLNWSWRHPYLKAIK